MGPKLGNPDTVEFGAVYFRKSNPPREDWARDYAVAKEDGHTIFRHWVPWSAVETAPGTFNWADYDEHLDLAARNGIKTVLAEFCSESPEWLYHSHPHARRERYDGVKSRSNMNVSSVTGGHFSMCLDNPEVAEAAGRFLRALGERYKDHPGMYAYDIWNECSFYARELICYCPATQAKFRTWLQRKYSSLEDLSLAWKRYSFTSWDQVELPRDPKPFPDVMDAIAFQVDNAYEQMQWRVDQLRSVDDRNYISAHGNAKTHVDAATSAGDDWRAGELVDIFGYTYWYGNNCDAVFAGDMIRSAARGREYWRAEAVGDSDWQNRKLGPSRADPQDVMHDPLNIRLDCMLSLMTGARGFLNPRWRPLLDGVLFGAFGWYSMDGQRTDRSAMITGLARWANTPDNAALWRSAPVRGDVGVLLLDEAQAHCYAMHGSAELYSLSVQGTCEAFLDANVQADPIKLDQIDAYKVVYLPYSLALSAQTIATLTAWVERGGSLVAEAACGYLDEHAHAFPTQPSRGLDKLFGVTEESINFGVDRWSELDIIAGDVRIPGGLHRQSYRLGSGQAVARFDDGSIAAVENRHGNGKTLLVGTMAGYGYKTRRGEAGRNWFGSLVKLGGAQQHITRDAQNTVARVTRTDGHAFVWVVNRAEGKQTVTLELNIPEGSKAPTVLRGNSIVAQSGNRLTVEVDGRDATVLGWAS